MNNEERNGLIKQRRLLREKVKKQEQEINRLNNIIDELEKEMNRSDLSYIETQYVLDKLNELKGDDK